MSASTPASTSARSPAYPAQAAPGAQAPGAHAAPQDRVPPSAPAPEPSMEELLASIRRIIAEEDLSAAMTPRPGPAEPAQAWTRPAPYAPHGSGYGEDGHAPAPRPAAAAYAPSRPAPQAAFPPPFQAAESYESRREAPPAAAAYAPPRPAQQGSFSQPHQVAEAYEPRREAPQPLPAAPARTAVPGGSPSDDPRRADMRRGDAARDIAAPRPEERGRKTPELHPEPAVPTAHRPEAIARHPSEAGYPDGIVPGAGIGDGVRRPAGSEPPRVLRSDGEAAGRVERLERRAGRMPGAAVPRKDLLGPDADAALSAAFHALGDLSLPQQPRTVEDLMKEILRPMLKDWLDRNLPAVVEDLVRAEIERVAARNRRG